MAHIKPKKLKFSRYIKEFLFKLVTAASLFFAIAMVFILIFSVAIKGYSAFFTNYLVLNINNSVTANTSSKEQIKQLLIANLANTNSNINVHNINIQELVSGVEFFKYENFIKNKDNSVTYKNFLLVSNLDMYLKGYMSKDSFNPQIINTVEQLKQAGLIKKKLNIEFFNNADSRYPENAGIKGAVVGSLYVVLLTTIFAIILSVGAAIYLEEFANKNSKIISIIDININNLAAIPSIIFGLLGLVIFENYFGIARGTPLLASLILTLMALPTIIITTKIALNNVPKVIKEAAYGLGASKLQVILFHSLPMSLPGILTGVIISISRIIGETAPLLMIGMVAFNNTVPTNITNNALVFPVQILLWFNNPELAFAEKASGAILILLLILLLINLINAWLRNTFEKKYK